MILDKTQQFASAQACTTTNGTNVIDLGAPGTVLGTTVALSRDVGPGEPIPFMAQVTTAFSGVGTFTLRIITAPTTSLTGGTVVAATQAFTATPLVAGYQIPLSILPNQLTGRYLGIDYVISTTTLTGSVTAAIVAGLQTNKAAGRA